MAATDAMGPRGRAKEVAPALIVPSFEVNVEIVGHLSQLRQLTVLLQ